MRKEYFWGLLALAQTFISCKKKNIMTFEQRYDEANNLYARKKYSQATVIYNDLYPQVPWKITGVDILKKMSDCKFQEKDYRHCIRDYQKLYETINDETRLFNAYRMCVCIFNMIEKNNKRDIGLADTLLEKIDLIQEEYDEVDDEEEKKILEKIQELKRQTLDKVEEKHFNIINTYEKLEMFDSAVVYAKNFLFKYPDSKLADNVAKVLLKNQFLSATKYEDRLKKKIDESKNKLFDKWREIILTFDNYKEIFEKDNASMSIYEKALKKMNLKN